LFAATTFADIQVTAHNFTGSLWGGGEICKPCHTPHFADETVGFLWAHELSGLSYSLYDGSTTNAGGTDMLDVHSRLCLSCHDGSVALNSYHNGNGQDFFISDANKVGGEGNLADDHPIGTATGPDGYPLGGNGDFNAATQSGSGYWGFGAGSFPEVPLIPFDPGSGEVQVVSCSTCHNPHGVTGVAKLLRKDNGASDLCLTCHIK
jgi:predicted CXXCH cytochrome family protein